ncbi:hypothetical protein [Nocardia wallacei]|uniref:hypothetical protein n=1 Tax=Nocardia wallacei TaxID=480035 RepID=UPI00245715C7|nr:hypothetical protein [Nocardia wallacei]
MADDLWADEETLDEPEWDQTSLSTRPPARPVRWWSDEDDTEELSQIEPDDWDDEEFDGCFDSRRAAYPLCPDRRSRSRGLARQSRRTTRQSPNNDE